MYPSQTSTDARFLAARVHPRGFCAGTRAGRLFPLVRFFYINPHVTPARIILISLVMDQVVMMIMMVVVMVFVLLVMVVAMVVLVVMVVFVVVLLVVW